MTLTISEAYELPRPEDIRAMGFVIKLRELAAGSPEPTRLVDDYVVTPAVAEDLPVVFDKMRQVRDRGEEYGRLRPRQPGATMTARAGRRILSALLTESNREGRTWHVRAAT